MKKFTRPNTSAASAGFSARAAYRNQRSKFARMSIKARLISLAAITAGGAILGFAAGVDPLLSAAAAATTAVVIGAVLLAPQTLLMLGMFAAYAAAGLVVGPMFAYTAAPSASTLSASSVAVIGVWMAAAAAFWMSVKFSRRTPWVTYLLALVGSLVLGGVLVILEPQLGMFALYFSMAIILVWRSAFGEWVKGGITLAYYKVRSLITRDNTAVVSREVDTDDEWLRRAEAERKTAVLLSQISDATVFHDRQLGKNTQPIPHLVIAPSGVVVAFSVLTETAVSETAAFGVEMDDLPLGMVASTLVELRNDVAKALRMPKNDVGMFIVAHSTTRDDIAGINRKVGVFTATDGDVPSDTIRLLGSDALISEIDTGFETLSSSTRKALTARARMRLRSAIPAPEGTYTPAENAPLGVVDADGRVIRPYATSAQSYSQLTPGTIVEVTTEEGDVLDNIVVVGKPYLDNDGHLVAPLALAEEYAAAKDGDSDYNVVTFRVDCISVAQ